MSKTTASELLRQSNDESDAYYDDAGMTEAQFAKKHRDAVEQRLRCRPDEAEQVCREMHKIMSGEGAVGSQGLTGSDGSA